MVDDDAVRKWWDSLDDAQRDEYRNVGASDALTDEQIGTLESFGVEAMGVTWETDPRHRFHLPLSVLEYIEQH